MIYFLMSVAAILVSMSAYLGSHVTESLKQQEISAGYARLSLNESNLVELLRAEIIQTLKANQADIHEFRDAVTCSINGICPTRLPASWNNHSPPEWISHFVNSYYTPNGAFDHFAVKITGVSASSDPMHFVDFSVRSLASRSLAGGASGLSQLTAASPTTGGIQTKIMRMSLGRNSAKSSFANAITAQRPTLIGWDNTTTFDHVVVYGNVATYNGLMAGWNQHTQIHGTLFSGDTDPAVWTLTYVASGGVTTTSGFSSELETDTEGSDATDDFGSINYYGPNPNLSSNPGFYMGDVAGCLVVRAKKGPYSGPHLAYNAIRSEKIPPKYNPEANLPFYQGSLRGGSIHVVPYGTNGAPASYDQNGGTINRVYEGNAILKGTSANPLVISGNVFFRGDVLISGVVKGQGQILSGRNIYITDDLTYSNPPPLFDGSETNNRKLTFVGDADKASELAAQILDYDRLGLVAANNIMIGDPYPEDEIGIVANDSRAIAQALPYFGPAQYVDKETGYMLDRIGANSCLIKPWISVPDYESWHWDKIPGCSIESGPPESWNFWTLSHSNSYPVGVGFYHHNNYCQGNFPSVFVPNPGSFTYWNGYNYPSISIPLEETYLEELGFKLPKSYTEILYPKNVKNGVATDWITRTEFLSQARNTTEQNWAQSKPIAGSNLRQRYKHIELPMPLTDNGGHIALPTKWKSGAEVVQQFKEWFLGDELNESFTGSPITFLSMGYDPPAGYPAAVSGADLAFNGAIADPAGHAPWFSSNTTVTQSLVEFIDACKSTFAMPGTNRVLCSFWYDPTPPAGQTAVPRAFVLRNDYGQAHSQSMDALYYTVDSRILAASPFFITINLEHMCAESGGGGSIQVETRYWDPTKQVRPHNRIAKVDAFLFANQFFAYSEDSISDRQLRLNGGITAKGFLARLVNNLGSDRTYTHGGRPTVAIYVGNGEKGSTPPLILKFDPRFALTNLFADRDLGEVKLVY